MKVVETEGKLLDKDYIKNLMDKHQIIKGLNIICAFTKSITSNTLYINFFGKNHSKISFRISDHLDKRKPMKQFLIKLNNPLTKKRIALLVRGLQNTINSFKINAVYNAINEVIGVEWNDYYKEIKNFNKK